jgi:hypothetical protein
MGIDERIWIDIHGPKDEIDVIEGILANNDTFRQLIYLYKDDNLSEGKSKLLELLLQDEGGKLFTLYKNGHTTTYMNYDLLLKLCALDFGPSGWQITRKNEKHLHTYCSYTFRSSYPKIAESIQFLSKNFPNTLIRYQSELDQNGSIELFICRYVNEKHIVWSPGWFTLESWHGWSTDAFRKLNAECDKKSTSVTCGCEPFLSPCEYISSIYDCSLEVKGIDKEIVDLFEKRGVKVNKNRDGLFIRFQYTKNPIKLMEWLSAKYKGCYFICDYSNEKGIQCLWEYFSAIHYPYVKGDGSPF